MAHAGTKIRVAIVGAGGISEAHLSNYHDHPRVRIVAICDINPDAAERAAKKYEVPGIYRNLDEMLAVEKPDAVSICTPNWLHTRQTISALEAGCHVLCEKPMALNVRDAEKMVTTSRRCGRLLMVPHRYQFSSVARHLKRVIEKGRLGRIYHIRACWTVQQFGWTDTWFAHRARSGGGILIDRGCYFINAALWFLGNPAVVTVSGVTHGRLMRRANPLSDVEDFFSALITTGEGATVCLQLGSMVHGKPDRRFSLYGEKGGAEWDMMEDPQLTLYSVNRGRIVTCQPKIVRKPFDAQIIGAFIRSIRTGTPPPSDGANGLYVAKVIDAIYASARKDGASVSLKSRKGANPCRNWDSSRRPWTAIPARRSSSRR